MEFYLPFKHSHMALVAISVLFFVFRALMMFAGSQLHHQRWAKMTSRTVDSLLLLSALSLCFIIQQYPFVQGWLTEKVIGVIFYIILAYVALYRAKSTKGRALATFGALAWVVVVAKLAVFKQALLLS